MLNGLRSGFRPAPAMAGATAGGWTAPSVLAFSETAGGGKAPSAAPPAESVTTPGGEILGRPMMNFIADMAAALGAVLLLVAFFVPYLGTSVTVANQTFSVSVSGFNEVLGWQGFLLSLLTLLMVVGSISFAKTKNMGCAYVGIGGFVLLFVLIQIIFCRGGAGPHVGWFFSLFGSLLILVSGLLQKFCFKCAKLEPCCSMKKSCCA